MDRVVGLGLRTSRVESQKKFAVGPEVRPYPGPKDKDQMRWTLGIISDLKRFQTPIARWIAMSPSRFLR